MNARQFVMMPKTIVESGAWRCGATDPKGKMGKDAFPLLKNRSFQLGNQWLWKADVWRSGQATGRLLIAYNLSKGNFVTMISWERAPKEFVVVASLEFHGDHAGWHVHSRSGDISEFAIGVTRQRNLGIRKPGKGEYHRPRAYADGTPRDGFTMSRIPAQNAAYRAFRIVDDTGIGSLFI